MTWVQRAPGNRALWWDHWPGSLGHRGPAALGTQPGVGQRVVAGPIGCGGRAVPAAPDEHLGPGPNSRVAVAGAWGAECGERSPAIGGRVIAGAIAKGAQTSPPAPDEHLGPSPDRGVLRPRRGSTGRGE